MIPPIASALALGFVGGCVYGLLLLRHSRIRSSLLEHHQTTYYLTTVLATIARFGFFAILCALVLRYAPQHFILMVGIFVGSLWLTIVITQRGNKRWRGLI